MCVCVCVWWFCKHRLMRSSARKGRGDQRKSFGWGATQTNKHTNAPQTHKRLHARANPAQVGRVLFVRMFEGPHAFAGRAYSGKPEERLEAVIQVARSEVGSGWWLGAGGRTALDGVGGSSRCWSRSASDAPPILSCSSLPPLHYLFVAGGDTQTHNKTQHTHTTHTQHNTTQQHNNTQQTHNKHKRFHATCSRTPTSTRSWARWRRRSASRRRSRWGARERWTGAAIDGPRAGGGGALHATRKSEPFRTSSALRARGV